MFDPFPLAPTAPEPFDDRPDVTLAFHEVHRLEKQAARFRLMAAFARTLGQDRSADLLEDAMFRTHQKLDAARAAAAKLSGRSIESDRLEDR